MGEHRPGRLGPPSQTASLMLVLVTSLSGAAYGPSCEFCMSVCFGVARCRPAFGMHRIIYGNLLSFNRKVDVHVLVFISHQCSGSPILIGYSYFWEADTWSDTNKTGTRITGVQTSPCTTYGEVFLGSILKHVPFVE